jgi:molecular chaperone GrpE
MSTHDNDPLDIKPEVPELKEILPEASELVKQLAECQKKVQENWEIALRSRAELDNVQKRAVRDIEHAHKFALEGFAKSLLPVVDSLERGLEVSVSTDEAVQNLRHGMELTLKLLIESMAKFHVEQLNPVDTLFDPAHHEALTAQPSDTVPEHTVITVVQKGYMLHGRLLRPAQVIVSKGKN